MAYSFFRSIVESNIQIQLFQKIVLEKYFLEIFVVLMGAVNVFQ